MRRTRERHQPFENIEKELIQHWVTLLNSHEAGWNICDGIKGLGEGKCEAKVTMTDGKIIKKEFDFIASRHAEMNAIFSEELYNTCDEIKSIEITSPPCPCCTVVLGVLGLSDRVISRAGFKKLSLSYNMSRKDFEIVFDLLIPKHLEYEAIYWFENVYKLFASGQWYNLRIAL